MDECYTCGEPVEDAAELDGNGDCWDCQDIAACEKLETEYWNFMRR